MLRVRSTLSPSGHETGVRLAYAYPLLGMVAKISQGQVFLWVFCLTYNALMNQKVTQEMNKIF